VTTTILECEPSLQMVGRADLRKWTEMIRAEYLELPGLSLTAPQVQRLWNLDSDTCKSLLDVMVRDKVLRQTCWRRFETGPRGR
jgi:hypothetical protein